MSTYAKAIVGAVVAGLSALVPALSDDRVTVSEWVVVVVLAIVGIL